MKIGLDEKLARGVISTHELLERYGDMSLHDFADLAIAQCLIPLNICLFPYDELAMHPQRQSTPTPSAQRELVS